MSQGNCMRSDAASFFFLTFDKMRINWFALSWMLRAWSDAGIWFLNKAHGRADGLSESVRPIVCQIWSDPNMGCFFLTMQVWLLFHCFVNPPFGLCRRSSLNNMSVLVVLPPCLYYEWSPRAHPVGVAFNHRGCRHATLGKSMIACLCPLFQSGWRLNLWCAPLRVWSHVQGVIIILNMQTLTSWLSSNSHPPRPTHTPTSQKYKRARASVRAGHILASLSGIFSDLSNK